MGDAQEGLKTYAMKEERDDLYFRREGWRLEAQGPGKLRRIGTCRCITMTRTNSAGGAMG